ncbi:MAG TPA: hypothetical protein QF703_01210 [Candidatus Thalassarchaeaceae archaeon]|nr:hypothetical protein [Candidatus Thalassarchaeaceae archaeon]|tara:strand:+ start:2087 stop:2683 length:597 start_codon:yes stop_codon:yes gene_type:complete
MTADDNDEFEDEIIEEMARMFKQMGMPVDLDILRSMYSQIRSQFEELGVDPDRIRANEIKLDFSDPKEIRNHMESIMSGPQGFGDFLRKFGIEVQFRPVESKVEVNVDESVQSVDDDSIPEEDIFVKDGKMHVTLDISMFDGLESSNLDVSLTGGGHILQLLKDTQLRPFKTLVLPHPSNNPSWQLNNGILDITFDLL